jgi:hypothetical protein
MDAPPKAEPQSGYLWLWHELEQENYSVLQEWSDSLRHEGLTRRKDLAQLGSWLSKNYAEQFEELDQYFDEE